MSFLEESEISWYEKYKNKTLIPDSVISGNPIPVLQYFVNVNRNSEQKAIAQFILSYIKNGAMLWELNQLWKNFIEKVV